MIFGVEGPIVSEVSNDAGLHKTHYTIVTQHSMEHHIHIFTYTDKQHTTLHYTTNLSLKKLNTHKTPQRSFDQNGW